VIDFVPNIPIPTLQAKSVQVTSNYDENRGLAYFENTNFEFPTLDSFEETMSDYEIIPRDCYMKYYSEDD
jgi:hypothetical protein